MEATAKHKRLFQRAAVAAVFLGLSIIMTWPMAANLRRHVVGEQMDSISAFYNIWWFHAAVADLGVSPWTNPLVDYPHGYSMVLFPVWLPYDIPTLPLVEAYGPDGVVYAFNLVSMLSFALAGLAGYLLASYLSGSRAAGFVSGVALAFLPFRFWHITRWHVSCLELAVLCFYFLFRTVRGDAKWAAPGLGASAAVLAYMSPNYAAEIVPALAIIIVAIGAGTRSASGGRAIAEPRLWKRLALASAVMMFLCAPLLARVAVEISRQPVPIGQAEDIQITYSANLLGYVIPGFNQRAYSWLTGGLALSDTALEREHGVMGYEVFAGYAALLGALLSLRHRRRPEVIALVLVAGLYVVLSMGPVFHIGGFNSECSAPYAWLGHAMPWLRVERAPVRHAGIALSAIAILAGIGLAGVMKGRSNKARLGMASVAALLVLAEFFQAPLPVDRVPAPAFLFEMRDDPAEGSVLNLPELPVIKRLTGYHQIHHGRPLINQFTRRVDDPAYLATPIYRYLDRPRIWLGMERPEKAAAADELRAEFRHRRLRYLVGFVRFMEGPDVAGLRAAMDALDGGQAVVDDGIHLVYRFDPEPAGGVSRPPAEGND